MRIDVWLGLLGIGVFVACCAVAVLLTEGIPLTAKLAIWGLCGMLMLATVGLVLVSRRDG